MSSIEDFVPEDERPLTEEELKARKLYNFSHGNFELTRTFPTSLEKR